MTDITTHHEVWDGEGQLWAATTDADEAHRVLAAAQEAGKYAKIHRHITFECGCGAQVHVNCGHDGECENCGAEYNGFGQRLRSGWRGNPSNYDDEVGDLEGYEMQYAGDQ